MATQLKYHYTECGLDNVYLVNGYVPVSTPRGDGVKIQNVEGLHRAIGLMLVEEKQSLNGNEFRFLRHEMNMTQKTLAGILGVEAQSVARWEKGQTHDVPSQNILRLLYREFVCGNAAIVGPLKRLAALDEALQCDDISFEDTADGWQPSLAA
jgi:DNA-binding transcriptional regulator YiaG